MEPFIKMIKLNSATAERCTEYQKRINRIQKYIDNLFKTKVKPVYKLWNIVVQTINIYRI